MTSPDRYELRWRRPNQTALLAVCVMAGLALLAASGSRVRLARHIPVWPMQVEAAAERIDPNTASAASLRRLRGIGQAKAQAIVDYRRTRDGPAFNSVADLEKVHGIGPRLVQQNRLDLICPPAPSQR